MKIIKKIFLLLVAAVLSLALGTAAFASEVHSDTPSSTEAITESGDTDKSLSTEAVIEENPFAAIFNTMSAYSSEIFSALAFIGTLIVAYFNFQLSFFISIHC